MKRRDFLIGSAATAVASITPALPALALPKPEPKLVFVVFRRFVDPSWTANQFIEVQSLQQYAKPEYVEFTSDFPCWRGRKHRKAFVVKEEDIPNQNIYPFGKSQLITIRSMLEPDYEAYLKAHARILYHDWDQDWDEMLKGGKGTLPWKDVNS